MKITVQTPLSRSARVRQMCGMFDLPVREACSLEWECALPLADKPWNVGLIVGPSGCGKSTIAKSVFPELGRSDLFGRPAAFSEWISKGSVIDAFPDEMPIAEVVGLLSAVGFSSPPAWLRPYSVLSTGQQFRVAMALHLAHTPQSERIVVDEFTSVVDRTAAQVGSVAIAKAVRKRNQRFVAITCHEDVESWLNPDWVYRPAENHFAWRCLRRRPTIELEIVRCQTSAWTLFAPHHYLSHRLHPSAVCFLATWNDRPVVFSAWLPFFGPGVKTRREHRTVTLPDYQGVGLGNAVSEFIAGLWVGLGFRAISTTTHPAMMRSRVQSGRWHMHRPPGFAFGHDEKARHATTRLTAGFTYTGPALPAPFGRALLEVRKVKT